MNEHDIGLFPINIKTEIDRNVSEFISKISKLFHEMKMKTMWTLWCAFHHRKRSSKPFLLLVLQRDF